MPQGRGLTFYLSLSLSLSLSSPFLGPANAIVQGRSASAYVSVGWFVVSVHHTLATYSGMTYLFQEWASVYDQSRRWMQAVVMQPTRMQSVLIQAQQPPPTPTLFKRIVSERQRKSHFVCICYVKKKGEKSQRHCFVLGPHSLALSSSRAIVRRVVDKADCGLARWCCDDGMDGWAT
ncbi:hypothetical protein IWX90DRAFT_413623 [Phyllosticta citrichinensis]|uniref:Secreted protein n=1 Tax=Phyllosticta citrichinensis TaxID=1130410 RepID=A0ABR1Y1J6_9PEZI